MTPEEEAKLRAQMAQARQEMDGDIEVEEPSTMQEAAAYYQAQMGRLHDWGQEHQMAERAPDVVKQAGQMAENNHYVPTPEEQLIMKARLSQVPYLGAAYSLGDYGTKVMQAGSMLPQHVITKGAQAVGDKFAAKYKEAPPPSDEEEERARKAIANLKAQEARAKQEKAIKDRDEAVQQGRRGYRVERALYNDRLYKDK